MGGNQGRVGGWADAAPPAMNGQGGVMPGRAMVGPGPMPVGGPNGWGGWGPADQGLAPAQGDPAGMAFLPPVAAGADPAAVALQMDQYLWELGAPDEMRLRMINAIMQGGAPNMGGAPNAWPQQMPAIFMQPQEPSFLQSLAGTIAMVAQTMFGGGANAQGAVPPLQWQGQAALQDQDWANVAGMVANLFGGNARGRQGGVFV